MILNILVAAFTSLFTLGSKSFSIDEIFSIQLASSSQYLNTMWFHEFNMWLYYFMLHFWLPLGKGEFFIRMPSAVFAVAAIPFIYKTTERLFDHKVAKLASLLTSINVFFVLYAQDARGYSLALLLCSASTYFFIRLVFNENKKNHLLSFLYFFVSVMAVYSHAFSFLIILTQSVSLLFLPSKKYLKSIVISIILVCLAIFPMLISPSFHSGQVNWISKPPITSVIGTYYILLGDFAPIAALYFLITLIFFPWRKIAEWKNIFVLMLVTVPVAITFLFSVVFKPIYLSKYFIILLPYLMASVSSCIYRIRTRWLFIVLLILSVMLSLVRLSFWYGKIDMPGSAIGNNNPDWINATNYLTTNSRAGDCVIFFTYIGLSDYDFYSISPSPVPVEIAGAPYTLNNGVGVNIPDPDLRKIDNLSCSTVWFVLNHHIDEGNNHIKLEKIEETLKNKYSLKKSVEFYKLRIEKFIRN